MNGNLSSFGLPEVDFKRVTDASQRVFMTHEFTMDIARDFEVTLPLAGDFFMIDFEPALAAFSIPGAASGIWVAFANQEGRLSDPIPVWHGTAIRAPFYGVALRHSVVGSTTRARIIYGWGVDMTMNSRYVSPIRAVTGALTILNGGSVNSGLSYYQSNTALAALTEDTIVAQATNTGGIWIQTGSLVLAHGVASVGAITNGNTGAASAFTNNAILAVGTSGTATPEFANLPYPMSIAPSRRLGRVSEALETIGRCALSYRLSIP